MALPTYRYNKYLGAFSSFQRKINISLPLFFNVILLLPGDERLLQDIYDDYEYL